MNKRLILLNFFLVLIVISLKSQTTSSSLSVNRLTWDQEYQLHLYLSNDSNYIMDIQQAHKVSSTSTSQMLYLPAGLSEEFIVQLKNKPFNPDFHHQIDDQPGKPPTLWSAVHSSLGGGWVHFVNCLLYSLESRQLDLTSPLMKRPVTHWKPRPMTETYKRTKGWDYYVPMTQKQLKNEYKAKEKQGQLAELKGVPNEFIVLALNTSQRDYDNLKKAEDLKTLARIDLVRLLLGANYLGAPQISYINTSVHRSIVQHSAQRLPQVIHFEDMNAAVIMTLDELGYRVDKLVFDQSAGLSEEEKNKNMATITAIVSNINEINKREFEQRLKGLYN